MMKEKMFKNNLKYLIELIQEKTYDIKILNKTSFLLDLKNPVKYLHWGILKNDFSSDKLFFAMNYMLQKELY